MRHVILFGLIAVLAAPAAFAQTQTVRGLVLDRDTRTPLIGANVIVVDSDPLIGAASDADGWFVIPEVPLGRQTIRVHFLGYTPRVLPNVLVRAGQETVLEIALAEQVVQGEEVVVHAEARDGRPLDDLAAVSARSFSVEEAQRYAGAVDDPARLATAFAGVATSGSGVQDNAISIRGNAPKGVGWRLEGVPIPTPSHFAGLTVAGGGGLTLFSGRLLSDSDVFTGAFPADPAWLRQLRERCDRTGALLIFDEIQTGFFRTGRLFAFEHYGVVPDILCMAKAMGGGMPLGAFASSPEILRVLMEDPPLNHVTTFGGHPMSCAAAHANLKVLLEGDFGARARRIEDVAREMLRGEGIVELRGTGAMLGLELDSPERSRKVVDHSFRNGVIVGWTLHSDRLIRIAPPLIIGEQLLRESLQILLEGMA